MTAKERRVLGRYVRWVADEIELRDWTVTVAVEVPDNADWVASCVCTPGRKQASLKFAAEFFSSSREEQRQTVVHELLHVHHEGCWRLVQTDLLTQLGQSAYDVFADSYRRAMEYAVDATADALAKHLPLIDWGSAGKETSDAKPV